MTHHGQIWHPARDRFLHSGIKFPWRIIQGRSHYWIDWTRISRWTKNIEYIGRVLNGKENDTDIFSPGCHFIGKYLPEPAAMTPLRALKSICNWFSTSPVPCNAQSETVTVNSFPRLIAFRVTLPEKYPTPTTPRSILPRLLIPLLQVLFYISNKVNILSSDRWTGNGKQ